MFCTLETEAKENELKVSVHRDPDSAWIYFSHIPLIDIKEFNVKRKTSTTL